MNQELREISPQNPFTFALPSGRLGQESVEFFRKAGIADFDLESAGRELSLTDKTGNFRIILLRNQDVPTYVLAGGADAGIAGRDVMAERGYDLTTPLELGFGICRLSVAAPADRLEGISRKSHLKVATKYPHLAKNFFFHKGISCEIIKLYGSIEIAPRTGLADCIVDLVSTGNTLKANGLTETDVILNSSAMLLVNRAAYALRPGVLRNIIKSFKAVLQ